MSRRWVVLPSFVILVTATLATLATLSACAPPVPPASTSDQAHVEPAKARKLFKEGAFLFDVRGPDEFKKAHIEGAENAPLATIDSRDIGPKDTPIILYCDNGVRAAKAAATLRAKGYTHVYELGGMSNWEK
jgi:phage shock protein E